MAVKAIATITLHAVVDVSAVYRYYKLQSATLSAPDKPTVKPADPLKQAPSGWSVTEPSYSKNSTDKLYTVDLTVFSDGTFDYSVVSLSSSYEAAKEAYDKAHNAQESAQEAAKVATNWAKYDDVNGLLIGNYQSGSWVGYRSQILSDSFNILNADGTVLASYGANTISLGKNSRNATIEMCGELGTITLTDQQVGGVNQTTKSMLTLSSSNVCMKGDTTSILANRAEVTVSRENIDLYCDYVLGGDEYSHIHLKPDTLRLESDNLQAFGYASTSIKCTTGNISLETSQAVTVNGASVSVSGTNLVELVDSSGVASVRIQNGDAELSGSNTCINGSNILYFGNGTLDILRLSSANVDGHFMFRPVSDGVTALGSTSQRWETVNAMILRSYDTSTTSSGVYARIYSNRIYRYSSSSRRYKEDIKPISSNELDPHNLYNAEVVQFKYKPGYLIEGDVRENKEIPGFIVEDLGKVYPIAIDYNEDGSPEMWNVNIMIPAMLKLIQEQNERIKRLEEKQ